MEIKKSSALKKISSACKSAAKRKFKVWPSAYASGWGVRCTRAGGPSKFGGGKNVFVPITAGGGIKSIEDVFLL